MISQKTSRFAPPLTRPPSWYVYYTEELIFTSCAVAGLVGVSMQLNIPNGSFDGYIFDLDGTLIDTMPLHYLAWQDALRGHGVGEALDETLFYSLGGIPALQVAETFKAYYGASFDPQSARDTKESLFQILLPQATAIDAVVAFARNAASSAAVGVASGGPRETVIKTLRHHHLDEIFTVVVTADDVKCGKPAPDSFLLAAQRMGVAAARCLVFEDAEPGFEAARAAGMQVVRVPSRVPAHDCRI